MNNEELFVNDLYLFYRYFVASDYANSVPAPHIKQLAHELMKLMVTDEYHRLAVSMPPRHSKSSMVTLAFPLWLIFQNPNRNILIITGPGLSEKFGIKIREIIRQNGNIFNCYLSDVKQSATHLMFCDKNKKLYNGSIRIASINGSVTGQDADVVILDDPYKGLEEEFTPGALQKKIDWVNRVLEQRIEPHTRYCVLHTRWVENDIIGYYKKTQQHLFRFIEFSAIQPDGTPLWKERYNITELQHKKENIGERMFSAIYQQVPLDMTSDFFNTTLINYKPLPDNEKIVATCRSWDIAGANNLRGDYTAGAKLSITEKGNIILTDLVHGKFSSKTNKVIQMTAQEDSPSVPILIESGVAAAGFLLFEEWKSQLMGFQVEQSSPVNSKVDRATPLRNLVFDGRFFVLLDDDVLRQRFIDEFRSFPNGGHDDIVDAVAYGVNWLKYQNGRRKICKPGLVRIRR